MISVIQLPVIGKSIAFELAANWKAAGYDTFKEIPSYGWERLEKDWKVRILVVIWFQPGLRPRSYDYRFNLEVVTTGQAKERFLSAMTPMVAPNQVEH